MQSAFPPVNEVSARHEVDSAVVKERAADSGRFEKLQAVRAELAKIIKGKTDVIDQVILALLAGGSVLLEDVPGVGKTTLAKSIATLIDLKFARVQCTPDLLPADILGGSVFQPATGEFEFRPGPVFCDLLIADEVNRASPRTQSALLEAMAEAQVTIDGNQYDLHQPFLVVATQNPSGFEGTFPLPESQLDRFLIRLSMDYPDAESEVELLMGADSVEPAANNKVSSDASGSNERLRSVTPIMSRADLLALQADVRRIHVDEKVARYIVDLVNATRRDSRLRVGCSPRGSKMLLIAAKSHALLDGRTFVTPDDVQKLAVSVIAHRVSSRGGASTSTSTIPVIDDIVRQIEVPV